MGNEHPLVSSLKDLGGIWERLFEGMPDGIALCELIAASEGHVADFKVLATNPSFIEQVGLRLETLDGVKGSELFGESPPPYLDLFIECVRSGTPLRFDTCIELLGRFLNITAFAYGDNNFALVVKDISDISRIESEMSFKRALLDTQQEASVDGILVIDENGRILSSNTPFRQMWGISEGIISQGSDELAIKAVIDKLCDPQAFIDRIHYLYSHPEEKSHEEISLKDGRTFDRHSAPLISEGGKIYGRVWFFRDITDRKKAEQQVLDSRAMLSSILKGLPVPHFVIDNQHRIISWNETLEKYTGWMAADVLNTSDHWKAFYTAARPCLADLVLDGDLENLGKWYPEGYQKSRLVEGGYESLGFFPHLGSDGLWLYFTAAPLRDEEGRIIGAVETLEDYTQRLKAEKERDEHLQAVTASEERLSRIFRLSPEMISICCLEDGRYIEVNAAFERITGYTREEAIGNTASELKLWLNPADEAQIARALSENGNVNQYEVEIRNKNGDTVTALLSATVLEGADYPMILAASTDITARKALQDERDSLRHLLNNIIDSMPSILVGIDKEGRVTQWNAQAARVTGIASSQAEGCFLPEVLPVMASHMERLRRALAERKPQHIDKVITYENGEYRYAEVVVYPLVDNQIEGAVVRLDDITDKVRLEEMMIQSEKMMSVGRLAAGMAHEINNPLGGILQGAQNIHNRLDPGFEKNRLAARHCGTELENIRSYMEERQIFTFLDGIRECGIRASRITSNMLQFSRRGEVSHSRYDVPSLIDRSIDLASSDYDLSRKYDFRHITIIREYEAGMPSICCAETEIEQVLLNLLKNAAQAMMGGAQRPADPRLTVRAYTEEDAAVIEVEDNGPGMDEAVMRRIFEPFYTTKATGAGTGLGLSVSYFIITQNHSGHIYVESSPGKGACFRIKLPVAEPDSSLPDGL